jgi:hypothetical protein
VLPKVKSWRDAGDIPYRKNHPKEAKLRLLHTLYLRIAFPLHVKWRSKEGSHAPEASAQTAWEDADHKVS